MPSDPPLNDNTHFHPERFERAVAGAQTYGSRFWIAVDPSADRSPGEWRRYEGRGGPWKDGDVAASAFDPVFRIVLDAMRACRVSGLTDELLTQAHPALTAWLARHATRSRRTYDIDVHSAEVRDDLDAWWWLVRNAGVCIACDVRQLDAATLFTTTRKLTFRTTRFLPAAVRTHVKEAVAIKHTVAIVPMPDGGGWQMVVGAAPGLIGSVVREALRRCQPPAAVAAATSKTPDVAILSTMEASTFWSSGIFGDNFEKVLTATLRRGENHALMPRDAIRALAAAEGVANAEGRGLPTAEDGIAALVTSWIVEKAGKADPLNDATIELAIRAVDAIISAGVSTRTRFQSEEGRALYTAELEGLLKRLKASRAARQARAKAPNAVPLSALREIPALPINWRTRWLHLMLDDVVTLLAAIRDETGAVPLLRMMDRSHLELRTDWDIRERLATIAGCPFDERTAGPKSTLDWRGEWPKLSVAQRVLVWWPDVSARPTSRDADGGWETVSWGHAELRLLGATPSKVLRSEWSYPTGTELKEEKFAGEGPWSETDWSALRRKTKAVASLISGTLGGVAPTDLRDTWTMAAAAQSYRSKVRKLMGTVYYSEAKLPE